MILPKYLQNKMDCLCDFKPLNILQDNQNEKKKLLTFWDILSLPSWMNR